MSKCGRQTKHKLGQTPTGDDADSAASVIADAWPFAPSTTALVKMEGRMMPFRMSSLGQKRSFAPGQPKVRFAPIADISACSGRTNAKADFSRPSAMLS
jgi:hypothetical protein